MSNRNSDLTNHEPFELITDSTNGSSEKVYLSSTQSSNQSDNNSSDKENFRDDLDTLPVQQPLDNTSDTIIREETDKKSNEINENNENKNLTLPDNSTDINANSSKSNQTEINSPSKTSDENSSFFNWLSNHEFLNKVVEKAARSVDTVITTLDPGMKKVLFAGGINILVTSKNEFNLNLITDAFIDVFKKATVTEFESRSLQTAVQLVGIESAKKVAIQRIQSLRENISVVAQNQVIVSIDNFLYNFEGDRWFDSDYFLLDDPLNKIQIEVHTQGTPIDLKYINELKSKINPDHKYREYGFDVKLDKIIADNLNCSLRDWHLVYAGFDKQYLHYDASFLLSNLYKIKLKSIGRNIS